MRLSWLIACAVLAVSGTASAVWLRTRGDGGAREAIVPVDERTGALRGIRFGDTSAEIRARLGERSDEEDGFFPSDTDFTGPPAIPSPSSDQGTRVPPDTIHYEDTAFLVSPTVGVFSMAILAEGATTTSGIGVGDELDRVRGEYERVECGESVAGESLFGGKTPVYPWCRATVGDVRVFFGEDPIESITLTRYTRASG